jgi:hypothetical protein
MDTENFATKGEMLEVKELIEKLLERYETSQKSFHRNAEANERRMFGEEVLAHSLSDRVAAIETRVRETVMETPETLEKLQGKSYSPTVGLIWATVQTGSPTLKRAKRRTLRFSPSLPIFCAIRSLMAKDWSLMNGWSSKQTSS